MLSIEPIKAFEDNYIWLLTTNERSIVIDPGESSKIKSLIDNNEIDLKGILITHHHYDHTNGLNDLSDNGMLDIYGPENNIVEINKRVKDSDCISIIGLDFEIIEVPGHTLDHIAFYSFNENMPILFCGDALFSGGCGRIFEGTCKQMFDSINKIKNLPIKTKIYCGHEYTKNNLDFCLRYEKDNQYLIKKTNWVDNKIDNKLPTIPTYLEDELKTNIFLRCDDLAIKKGLNMEDASEELIFEKLRNLKDKF